MTKEAGKFFIVGTPIGNLGDLTFRALETLKLVDVIFCEDTRRSIKLLNAYEIKKPLKSCPHFREKRRAEEIVSRLQAGESVAYISDAGMPVLNDPGADLVAAVREAGLPLEVIGGTSAITHFLAGLGRVLDGFRFVGFLPARTIERERFFDQTFEVPTLFFESPHRMESTLKVIAEKRPELSLCLGKELSKISERYFFGSAQDLLKTIPSWKGEWIGAVLPIKE